MQECRMQNEVAIFQIGVGAACGRPQEESYISTGYIKMCAGADIIRPHKANDCITHPLSGQTTPERGCFYAA